MRSLRKRLREAVLAVPVATACLSVGCSSQAGGSSSGSHHTSQGTSSSSSSSGAATTSITGCTIFCAPERALCAPEGGCVETCEALCDCEYTGTIVADAGPTHDGGELDPVACQTICPIPSDVEPDGGVAPRECHVEMYLDAGVVPSDDGGLPIACTWLQTCSGRRPEGLADTEQARSPGEYLAMSAQLEAAAVPAFGRLAEELRALGAPAELVARAESARDEEVRHAQMMGELARSHGAAITPVEVGHFGPRSRLALAQENAVEGCVRETFGAALALYQAEHAQSPELRRAMVTIAEEEAGHAELAWDVSSWLEGQLNAGERAALARARTEAVDALGASLATSPAASLRDWAGLPTGEQAHALFARLQATVWSAGCAS